MVWLENSKSWVKTKCTESWRKVTRETEIGVEAFLTLSQLGDLYKSPEIAEAIVAEKQKDPTKWRPHPEVPWMLAARQYKVLVRAAFRKELERIKSQQIDWQSQVSNGGAQQMTAMMDSHFSHQSPTNGSPLAIADGPAAGGAVAGGAAAAAAAAVASDTKER